jgi:hypothetical protein
VSRATGKACKLEDALNGAQGMFAEAVYSRASASVRVRLYNSGDIVFLPFNTHRGLIPNGSR